MVQVINLGPSRSSLQADILGNALGEGLGNFTNAFFAQKELNSVLNNPELQNAPASKRLQALTSALTPFGETGQKLLQNTFMAEQQRMQETQQAKDLNRQKLAISGLEKIRSGKDDQLTEEERNAITPAEYTNIVKAAKPAGGITAQAVPPAISNSINKIIRDNPKASSDELLSLMNAEGIPPVYSNPFTENRRRKEEFEATQTGKENAATRKELAPIKADIIAKANNARQSIANKEQAIQKINEGNLDDPTVALVLDKIPGNFGKRFLSDDTVAYKASLVDEFKDLKNIFAGATRVVEIEKMEDKIADVYLTDSQKKAILSSRIDALQADVLRAEAAEEIEKEHPFIGALEFDRKVADRTKEKLGILGDKIISQQKNIIDEAELKKNYTLNYANPDDKQIVDQILREAGGDKKKAREIAIKKGYKL